MEMSLFREWKSISNFFVQYAFCHIIDFNWPAERSDQHWSYVKAESRHCRGTAVSVHINDEVNLLTRTFFPRQLEAVHPPLSESCSQALHPLQK